MGTLKIRKVGNSLGVTFPKDLLETLNVQEGDELYLIKTERGFELTPYNQSSLPKWKPIVMSPGNIAML
jgi:putative addiction module antidote